VWRKFSSAKIWFWSTNLLRFRRCTNFHRRLFSFIREKDRTTYAEWRRTAPSLVDADRCGAAVQLISTSTPEVCHCASFAYAHSAAFRPRRPGTLPPRRDVTSAALNSSYRPLAASISVTCGTCVDYLLLHTV